MGVNIMSFSEITIMRYSKEHEGVLLDRSSVLGTRVYFRGFVETFDKSGITTHALLFEANDNAAERIKKLKLRVGSKVTCAGRIKFAPRGEYEAIHCDVKEIDFVGNRNLVEKKEEKVTVTFSGSEHTINLDKTDCFIMNAEVGKQILFQEETA